MKASERPVVPQEDVLAWLKEKHPELHASAVPERSWVWLTANLQGEEHREVRLSIKQYGFVFTRFEHKLPDGQVAHWAHHGEKPTPFRRKKRGAAGAWSTVPGGQPGLISEQDRRQAAIEAAMAALAAAG